MWFALDLDQTLIDEHRVPFPGVVEILRHLQLNNYPMAVVSYNLQAELIVEHLGWTSYFRKVICDRLRSKAQIIKDISPELQLKVGDAVLVDDLEHNIKPCFEAGIHAVQVNPVFGFQVFEVQQLLQYHKLPVLWLSSLPIEHRVMAQAAFPNYFVRFYSFPVGLDELVVYARDNTANASVVGTIQQEQDQYGRYYVVMLRDCKDGVHSRVRSVSLPVVASVRIPAIDILYHVFVLCNEQLEYQVRSKLDVVSL